MFDNRRSANGNHREASKRNQQSRNSQTAMQSFFGFPNLGDFGFGSDVHGGSAGFSSFSSFSSGGPGVVKSTSKSTKVVNGKKYVTTK